RVVRDLSSKASIDLGAELYAAGWDSPGFILVPQFDQQRFDSVANRTDGGFKHRAQERVSLRVLAGSSLTWRSTVYTTQGRWQLFLTTPPEGGITEGTGSQLEEEDRRYGFGATSALTWILPRALITLGGEGRLDHSRYENYFVTNRVRDSSQVLVRARQVSGGLFLQSATDLTRRLQVTIGGRYERHGSRSTPTNPASPADTAVSAGRGIFAPKFGALFRLPGFGSIYANASRGFRRTDGVIVDPTLPFITAWAYEGGIKLDIDRLSASAAVFRMDVSDEQTFDPITLTSSSGGSSRRQGVELGFQARLTPAFTARADWTFNDAKYRRLITDGGDTLSGARVFNTAKHLGTIAADLAPPSAIWQFGASANVVGPYTPFNEVGVVLPIYALVHAYAGVHLGVTQLQIGVRNLLDHVYPELRAGGFVSPGQPRSAYGTVRYVF
ncbi:MAG: TonB-dependent receptor, partial [Gemmatimonadales bacterium]